MLEPQIWRDYWRGKDLKDEFVMLDEWTVPSY